MKSLELRSKCIRHMYLACSRALIAVARLMYFVKPALGVQTEVLLELAHDAMKMDFEYRTDMLVNDLLIVELKSVEENFSVHLAQTLSYMKLSQKRLGLIINFNVLHLKDGLKRLVEGTGWK